MKENNLAPILFEYLVKNDYRVESEWDAVWGGRYK